ncbi:Alpha-L-arabinofuranosidase 1, partial [Mucuna pruriens]
MALICSLKASFDVMLYSFMIHFLAFQCCCADANSTLVIHASNKATARRIPNTFLGVFVEEINHAGAGGLWAELVSNRGFEARGSNIYPWSIIGNESSISVLINRTSCFKRNKAALQMKVHCGGHKPCPSGGVGISNPGYWGMNIEQGKRYKVVYHVKSKRKFDLKLSFTGVDVIEVASNIRSVSRGRKWKRVERIVEAKATNHNSSLQITTTSEGSYLLDQVSAMPLHTYMGHGFRKDLFKMVADLKPKFLRFPEDLGALPIWVFNAGISHKDEINTSAIAPYVQDVLDGIEFARGSSRSKWGYVRTALGHPKPFNLRYVAIGNEDCSHFNYQGNYMKFYFAVKSAYPDIKIISNCDASSTPLNHPADLFDFHIYTDSNGMFSKSTRFDHISRSGPKMVSYAPLFSNINDRTWIPDAIVFDSYQLYGTPSYWVQKLFIESSGATFLDSTLNTTSSNKLIASSIIWQNSTDMKNYLRIKVVNFGTTMESLNIHIKGLNSNVQPYGSTKTLLASTNVMDENCFLESKKVATKTSLLEKVGKDMNVILSPYSVTSLDFKYIVVPSMTRPTHMHRRAELAKIASGSRILGSMSLMLNWQCCTINDKNNNEINVKILRSPYLNYMIILIINNPTMRLCWLFSRQGP